MSLPAEISSLKLGDASGPNDLSDTPGLSECNKNPMEAGDDDGDEEEEEEDVDFNPSVKGSPSAEASSSLSSEVDGLDANVDSDGESPPHTGSRLSLKQSDGAKDCTVSNSGYSTGMDFLTEYSDTPRDGEEDGVVIRKFLERKLFNVLDPEDAAIEEKENASGSGTDVVSDVPDANVKTTNTKNLIVDVDIEDAICKRTRARYSLTNFTLDELETFLQETDDEDDFQNVDEEEEYRKFLTAVLQGGDGADPLIDNGNDEDEDNDADFEIEIEEALESDPDNDCLTVTKQKEVGVGRRPETRQNKRQKVSLQSKGRRGQSKRPLCPRLPMLPNAPSGFGPGTEQRYIMPDATQLPPSQHVCVINGFTPYQIGQLYSLIHEHVQLLIQVYSLCVLDPSRQHISSQVQGLVAELNNKRNQTCTWRNMPYPSFCFGPPYVRPSVSDEDTVGSSQITGGQRVQSSMVGGFQVPTPSIRSVPVSKGCSWLPSLDGAVLSILDVAPLKLVGRYIDDVSNAVKDQQRRYLVADSCVDLIKEPLFPLPVPTTISQVKSPVRVASNVSESNVGKSSSPNQKPLKKTLAATLVENTKKQCVALVPREIAKLAQQFYPLFNPALFPHKAPPSSVANRVLFTDAEDELLALGMMEFNNDWKTIQQRFLPCKSKHQIFVRQKNRCSAKAPENPIKAVRRMKTSPLNPDEIARIQEGLKVFKLDWMSIWKFVVPYRDPSLLPRQWRIALGTQKSYKVDPSKKEKRRLYESQRRSRIAALNGGVQIASEKEYNQTEVAYGQNDSGEDCLDNENGAYVHEAFLADWRPASSCPVASEICTPSLSSRCLLGENSGNQINQESQTEKGQTHELSNVSVADTHPVPHGFSNSFKGVPSYSLSQSTMRPPKYRARRPKCSHLVRLAPELPPVNLPPSARVISHAAFRSSQNVASALSAPAQCSTSAAAVATRNFGPTSAAGSVLEASENVPESVSDSSTHKNISVTGEKGTNNDLQMHPLLFQTPNHERLPYVPATKRASPNSFSFFPASPHQIPLSPFQNPRPGGLSIACSQIPVQHNEGASEPSGLDFHPLLQRTEDFSSSSSVSKPSAKISTNAAGFKKSDEGQTLGRAAGHITVQSAACAGTTSPICNANNLNLEFNLSSVPAGDSLSSKDPSEVLALNSPIGCTGISDNHSMQEIVMEQEELSDSDDEIEDVEFECEEMADSEGEEGSECELNENAKDKDRTDLIVGPNRHASDFSGTEDPEGVADQNQSTSSRMLDLLGPVKDSGSSPWLSLGSHAPTFPCDSAAGQQPSPSRVERSRNRNPGQAKT